MEMTHTASKGVTMGKISTSTFVSLDGVVNHMERWHFDYMDAESDALAMEQIEDATALLMGRATYEVYESVWPTRDGEYADAINAIPKYVASTTLTDPTWNNTTVLEGELVEAVAKLRDRDESILMHGYGPVAKTLLAADLLTEMHVWVHPQLAGVGAQGDLLLHQGLNKKLELAGTRTFDSGVVVLSFRNPDA